MTYGERVLQRGAKGEDVEELQLRLAGFRGTVPDGDFGPLTEMQVMTFQRDVMGLAAPTGIADGDTLRTIDAFAEAFPLDFDALRCPCGVCAGFGQERFKGSYRAGRPHVEAFHRYEYPGIHRMLLWAVRAVFFYLPRYRFLITSGYRCGVRNRQTGRTSTNHHGKAIDIDVARKPGEDKRDDMNRCDEIRGVIVRRSNAQLGWLTPNMKALEPARIAPTWVHYDVRNYAPKYLDDRFFCTDAATLDHRLPIQV
ncbi:peptidoglycan-binding protein [Rhodocaloribacter sp.]